MNMAEIMKKEPNGMKLIIRGKTMGNLIINT